MGNNPSESDLESSRTAEKREKRKNEGRKAKKKRGKKKTQLGLPGWIHVCTEFAGRRNVVM